MVDHIHFPKSVTPLFPTEKIKKVRRRKDKQQESGFKENLEKEKKNSEDPDEDSYEPDQKRKPATVAGTPDQIGPDKTRPSSIKKNTDDDRVSEKRIDVHA